MKQLLSSIVIFLSLTSCTTSNDVYKNTVLDYLQTGDGIKTDFKIEFQKFELSDITVADSIKILQEQYQAEKQKKIKSAQQSITHWEEAIEKQRKKGDGSVAKTLISRYQKDLEKAQAELEEAKQWKVDYISRYDGRSGAEVLAKKADTYFSFQNPKLTQSVRQEMGTYFVLSPDGRKCHKMVKQTNQ